MIAHHLGADELRHVVLFDLFKIQAKRYHQLLTTGFGIQNPILVEQNMNLCNMLIGIKADQTPTVLDCMKMYTGVVDMGHFEDELLYIKKRASDNTTESRHPMFFCGKIDFHMEGEHDDNEHDAGTENLQVKAP